MARTYIFDSADPENSTFIDEVATYTSNDEIDEDFLSFEDDLHTSSSQSTSSSSDDSNSDHSGHSRLTRFMSRNSTSEANNAQDDSSSTDDGRSQRLVRAISRVVMAGSSSVTGRHRSRANSVDSDDDAGEGPSHRSRRRRRRAKKTRQKSTLTERPASRSSINNRTSILEDLNEDSGDLSVQIISGPDDRSAAVPGVLNPGILNNKRPVTINDPGRPFSQEPGVSSSTSSTKGAHEKGGIRLRKLISKIAPSEKPHHARQDQGPSTSEEQQQQQQQQPKKTRRRYSGSMGSAAAAQRRAGWEPGVDIRTTDIILQSIGSAVTIVDYSVTRYRIVQTEVYPAAKTDDSLPDPSLTINKEFHHHLNSRPSWSQVRWISVNGLSWEAISAISQRYQLHRLAIEDMVDIPQRTKVDLYPTHTFCCLPLHKMISYKPVPKQDYGFWDWVLRRDKKLSRKRPTSTSGSGSRLAPTMSNASSASVKKAKLEEKRRLQEQVVMMPGKPPVTLPADSGRRRTTMPTAGGPRKIIIQDSSSSSSDTDDAEDDYKPLNTILAAKGMETIYDWNNPYAAIQQKSMYIESKRPLSAYKRAVGVEQVSLFLTSQDTVISFFERSATDIERPLLARLSTQSTILRESCDPSLLLQAIVDAIVDLIQPIIAVYRRRLDELEVDAMINPSMSHTQDLHLMAGELSMLRNTIVPITSLVLSLRDHTSAAQEIDIMHHGVGENGGKLNPSATGAVGHDDYGNDEKATSSSFLHVPEFSHNDVPGHSFPTTQGLGFPVKLSEPSVLLPPIESIGGSRVSALAKVYLADISDHLLSHTQDLDVMRNNTKNMIDLIFNTISIQSSDSVKQLSIITVIFLPLSFWTGYFGMNFKQFGVLDQPISYYWLVSVPFCVGVLLLAMVNQIISGFRRGKIFVKSKMRNHQRRVKKRMRKEMRRRDLGVQPPANMA